MPRKAIERVKLKRAGTGAPRPPAAARPPAPRPARPPRRPAGAPVESGASPSAATRAAGSPRVRLLLPDESAAIEVPVEGSLASDAMYWSYVTRQRDRWGDASPGDEKRLAGLVSIDDLKRIAAAGLVEVEVPWIEEGAGWEARIFPWEYLLSRLTKPYRTARLTVVRRLAVTEPQGPAQSQLDRVAVVESAPDGLKDFYDVSAEGDLMLGAMGKAPLRAGERAEDRLKLRDPSLASLEQALAAFRPTVVHVAGIDNHQALELLGKRRFDGPGVNLDGLALRNARDEASPTQADQVAHAVGGARPHLVVHNYYDSASRIAALTVAEGAGHAIGFHDTIDDSLAEMFCTSFYRELRRGGGDVLAAFKVALAAIREVPEKLRGACVVLWSARSLVRPEAGARRPRAARVEARKPEDVPARQQVEVKCVPLKDFNYSMLHNGRSLFRTFTIYRLDYDGPVRGIEVEVDLFVGEGSFAYRATVDLPEAPKGLDLRERVVVPLTAEVIRTQGEAILSSLFVSVRYQGETLLRETYPVRLEPVDGWTDTPRDREWLPTFVLPRDPAVARVIGSAQRYLMAIADDPAAGFDGYQSVEADPRPAPEARCATVDAQVRAIWSALLYDHELSYINPPPSFEADVQRLRTPTDVLRGRRGTCIDLALLVASCLEYVDLYPVIFLLKGHAFPGYWRGEEYHDDFARLLGVTLPASPAGDQDRGGRDGTSLVYGEMRERLRRGELVALETVWLTNHSGFGEACQAGLENLRNGADFEAMLDVKGERSRGVTPLPLLWRPE